MTNIASGDPEQTRAVEPALPLLILHLGGQFHLLGQLRNTRVQYLQDDQVVFFAFVTRFDEFLGLKPLVSVYCDSVSGSIYKKSILEAFALMSWTFEFKVLVT